MNGLAGSERPLTLPSRKKGLLPGEPGLEEGFGKVSPQTQLGPHSALTATTEKSFVQPTRLYYQ